MAADEDGRASWLSSGAGVDGKLCAAGGEDHPQPPDQGPLGGHVSADRVGVRAVAGLWRAAETMAAGGVQRRVLRSLRLHPGDDPLAASAQGQGRGNLEGQEALGISGVGKIPLHAHFEPMSASQRLTLTDDLFGISGPDGFAYRPALFSPDEERPFVAECEKLPFKPFEFHGYLGNRRIVSFGYRYDYAGRALRDADAMPVFLEPLKQIAAGFSGIPARDRAASRESGPNRT
jgi:hypothetical protein